MKADFTRDTFDRAKHYTAVLMQQGRVQLDADWNEQTDIQLHYLRALAADIIGPHGGPEDNCGFEIIINDDGLSDQIKKDLNFKKLLKRNGFIIGKGHYYVDGILCENEDYVGYGEQEDFPLHEISISPRVASIDDIQKRKENFLVYLDVWEREVTYLEDKSIREVALGNADTAIRSKLVWQVKAQASKKINDCDQFKENLSGLVNEWQPENRGKLKARVIDRNRGLENQLYRIEVHRSGYALGTIIKGIRTDAKIVATFKWSRDNGSVAFPVLSLSDKKATLANPGKDTRILRPGNWVEIVDDEKVLHIQPGPLAEIDAVEEKNMCVKFKKSPGLSYSLNDKRHPILRRWDQKSIEPEASGALIIDESYDKWIMLEDDVQVQFLAGTEANYYRTGDYWLIPARIATEDVEWPGRLGNPNPLPPHGVEHHYAPLAIIDSSGIAVQCHCKFRNLCNLSRQMYKS